MERRFISILLCVGVMITLLSGCGNSSPTAPSLSSPGGEENDPIVFKFNDQHNAASDLHRGVKEIAAAVEEATDGKIIIEMYPSSQLSNNAVGSIQMDSIDMGLVNSSSMAQMDSTFECLNAPFLFTGDQHAQAVADDPEIMGYLNKKMLEENNLRILGWVLTGSRNMFSRVPIATPEEFKNKKIRTMENDIHMATFNTLGAVTTPVAWTEVFTALQQGTIDAAENTIGNILGEKFYEVAPYVTLSNHFYSFNPILISNAAYDKIPEDLKEVFEKAVDEGCHRANDIIFEANDKAVIELKELGATIYELDPKEMSSRVESVYDQFEDLFVPELIEKIKSVKQS